MCWKTQYRLRWRHTDCHRSTSSLARGLHCPGADRWSTTPPQRYRDTCWARVRHHLAQNMPEPMRSDAKAGKDGSRSVPSLASKPPMDELRQINLNVTLGAGTIAPQREKCQAQFFVGFTLDGQ